MALTYWQSELMYACIICIYTFPCEQASATQFPTELPLPGPRPGSGFDRSHLSPDETFQLSLLSEMDAGHCRQVSGRSIQCKHVAGFAGKCCRLRAWGHSKTRLQNTSLLADSVLSAAG